MKGLLFLSGSQDTPEPVVLPKRLFDEPNMTTEANVNLIESSQPQHEDEILPPSDPLEILPRPQHLHSTARHIIKTPDETLHIEMSLPTRYVPVIDQSTGCVKILGQGGYGIVVACWDHERPLDTMDGNNSVEEKGRFEVVAVKMIKSVFDGGAPYRMLREIKIMKHLCEHNNIVKLIDIFVSSREKDYCIDKFKDLYIVMGMMKDGDLKNYLNKLGKQKQGISMDFIKEVMWQMLDALQYMNECGILHRDLKPANILVDTSKDRVNVRLSDFGLSTIEDCDTPINSQNSMYVVTRYYRPPEVILQYELQSIGIDSWGLGCIFAELLYMLPPKPQRRPLFIVKNSEQDMKGILEHLNLITSLIGKPHDTYNDIKVS